MVQNDKQTVRTSVQEFWNECDIFASSIIHKLDSITRSDLVGRMRDCGTHETALTCENCGHCKVITDRCERRWCPRCCHRLARERVEELEIWVKTLKQPKHVVLTCRNTETLTRSRVRHFLQALARLRRTRFASNWTSGIWCLEVTNESRGWHLHAHLLIEAKWIDSGELAITWGKQVNQDYAIVKVKDARDSDYLKEVAKYVVKSSELAKWEAEEIAEFITAFKGRRAFGVFGELVGKRSEWKQTLRALRDKRNRCKCGCNQFRFEDARIAELSEHHKRVLRHR